ncbi:hypothetical protein CR513_58155, partial [Mucuna pruriens]
MLLSLVIMPQSSNTKCFKCLGKRHITFGCPNKRIMIMRTISYHGGNNINVASSRLVEKLKLPTQAHLRPHKLHWLIRKGELVVAKHP